MSKMTDGAAFLGLDAMSEAIAPFAGLTDIALANIRRVYEALIPNRETLAVLFALDAAQTEPAESWITFFVETASAQLIWDERPTGVVTAADAAWVLARFDEAPSLAILAVLARMVEEAQRVPAAFAAEVRQRAALFGPLAIRPAAPASKTVPYLRLVA